MIVVSIEVNVNTLLIIINDKHCFARMSLENFHVCFFGPRLSFSLSVTLCILSGIGGISS